MGIFDRFRSTALSRTGDGKPGIAGQDAARLIDQGHALEAQGRLDEAMQCYLEAIRLAPNPARGHLNRGNILLLQGDLQGALDAFRTALKHQPDYAGAYYNIGNALLGNRQLDEAAASYRRALEIQPDYVEVHCSLGVALRELGQLDSAVASFRRALEIDPGLVEAQINLGLALQHYYNAGNLLLNAGKLEDAVANFRRVLEIEPNLADAHFNLGNTLKRLGRNESAMASYRRALEIKPDFAEAHGSLGVVLHDLWKFDEEVASYRRALSIKPDFAEAHSNLGVTLKEQGKLAESEASYRRALEIQPDNAMFRVAQTFTLPIAPQTIMASAEIPAQFNQALRELSDWLESSPANRARFSEAAGSQQPFYLAYRDGNHVERLSRYGDLVAASPGQVAATPGPARKKIRLIVVSNHFRRHSVWDVILRGILANLDRTRFEVFLYNMSHVEDEETIFAKSQCDVWRDFHTVTGFDGWLEAMKTDRPDVIFYPEIGMDTMTLRLAARRLAPLQVAGWGHPITTGLPTMDLYFSGEMLEAPDADAHYRERLARLPGTGCCTTPIELKPEALPELEAELAKRRGVCFVIAQTPFKFDPADDALFADIAAAVGESTFILLSDPQFSWATEQLIARLNRAFRERGLDPEQHLLMVPWLSREKFHALLEMCDIYLDCPSFSGYTTAWQAVHRGLPVVTLEGKFMRQRLAAGLLRKIGMTDTIAASKDDYVAIAARLATECREPIRRNARRNELKTAAPRVDQDIGVVRAFEQSVIDALAERERHFEFDALGSTTSLSKAGNQSKSKEKQMLSIVINFFNNRREAENTLYSLTRAYQNDLDDIPYEVIVLDNGSTQPLSEKQVLAFGPEFKYRYISTTSVSPVQAINTACRDALGEGLLVIIDGAHIISPGVLRRCADAFSLFSSPFIATVPFHLGPKRQNESITEGYNQSIEDQLLSGCGWKINGYNLYKIAGDFADANRGWFGCLFESSCFGIRKADYLSLGGLDERFQSRGGGLVSPDFFNRAVSRKNMQYVVLLGEGTFHQVHGGVASNAPYSQHPATEFHQEYVNIRGAPYQQVLRKPYFMGILPDEALHVATISAGLGEEFWLNNKVSL
jgi:protein O-GlcNAc transferase